MYRSHCRRRLVLLSPPQVNSWLGAVFGDQPVPQFEVNTRTVDILYQLAQSSEARCSDTALLIEDYKQKASEYQADGEEQTVGRINDAHILNPTGHLPNVTSSLLSKIYEFA